MKPLVAVLGRPNVGKSTFFNKMCGKRLSIVEDTPGVTRDRIYTDVTWLDKTFTLVDTGGIELKRRRYFLQRNVKAGTYCRRNRRRYFVFYRRPRGYAFG